MILQFRVSPRAERQIRTAADWWIRNRTAAPTAFADDLEAAFTFIQAFPYAGEAVPHKRLHGVRRVLLGRTHHHLYYVVSPEEDGVEVLALWHTSRGKGPRL